MYICSQYNGKSKSFQYSRVHIHTVGNMNSGNRSRSKSAREVSAVATSSWLPRARYEVKVRIATSKGMAVYKAPDKETAIEYLE